jgi:antitoxin MazE
MQINVVQIGNSRGIRIPKKVLDQCHVDDVLELTIQNNEIVLTPVHRKPREGWVEAFEAVTGEYGEEPLDQDWLDASLVDEDDLEW